MQPLECLVVVLGLFSCLFILIFDFDVSLSPYSPTRLAAYDDTQPVHGPRSPPSALYLCPARKVVDEGGDMAMACSGGLRGLVTKGLGKAMRRTGSFVTIILVRLGPAPAYRVRHPAALSGPLAHRPFDFDFLNYLFSYVPIFHLSLFLPSPSRILCYL